MKKYVNLEEVVCVKIFKHLYVCIQADRLQLVSMEIFLKFASVYVKSKDIRAIKQEFSE